ncbi:unnamed protein product [Gongylonema pulchrum]|uniref:Sulfate_transp domain-containing protein n=1 Tax=Gongylonema pulchrum TaxID=637853 RepID=A0A183CWF2_9BILA|nr:unnamed protein product [Gongylonema pulchrum]
MSPKQFIQFIFSFVPILATIKQYRWRQYIFGDFVAGVTVGIMHVPQGIAYSFLVGVDPIYGLYSSFFPVLVYMLFGTSKHVSIGSFAVISLMTGTSRVRILKAIYTQFLQQRGFYIESAVEMGLKSINFKNLSTEVPFNLGNVSSIQVVTALTFCIGVVQVTNESLIELVFANRNKNHAGIFCSGLLRYNSTNKQANKRSFDLPLQLMLALLHVEFIASYMSDQLISGFSAGASVHVIFVQLDKVFQACYDSYSNQDKSLATRTERTRGIMRFCSISCCCKIAWNHSS